MEDVLLLQSTQLDYCLGTQDLFCTPGTGGLMSSLLVVVMGRLCPLLAAGDHMTFFF